ncbi:MAG: SRPBCC family protein [Pyrinomonadaceae bacterium]
MIKKILIALVAIVVLLVATVAIASFATATDFKVEREVTINKPKAEVFAYIKELKNQNEWGPWIKRDPAIKLDYKGTDGTVGFVSSWKSEKADVGSGEQEITKIVEGELIDSQLRFREPFESKADAYMITEASGDVQTKVKWGFSSSMPRPMNIMLLFMDMDKEVGKDFDEGLASLKSIMEKQ